MGKGAGGNGRTTRVMTFEQFALSRGAGREEIGEAGLHRLNSSVSGAARQRATAKLAQQVTEWGARREGARQEYERLTRQGSIRAPTRIESLRTAARGHPDLVATQAARRLLAKQGVNW